jgi:type II secretory ATPase GspE/PulE/Tfp pilus assembly ATPase PilB-like protein
LCEKCKVADKLDSELKIKLEKLLKSLPERVDKKDYEKIFIYKPKGCVNCGNSGYKGRIAIYELMQISKEIELLMNKEAGEIEIQEFALKEGMATMQQDGILKVMSGVTTLDEVEKVTGALEL